MVSGHFLSVDFIKELFNLGENNNGFGIGDYMINNSKHEKYNWDSGSFYFGNILFRR